MTKKRNTDSIPIGRYQVRMKNKESAEWVAAVVVGFIAVFFSFAMIILTVFGILFSTINGNTQLIMFMPFFGFACSFIASGKFLEERISMML